MIIDRYQRHHDNNYASVITVVLMYLQWQAEIVYSGSINTSDHSSIFDSYLGSEYRTALITDNGGCDRNGCQAFWIMIVILLMYRKTATQPCKCYHNHYDIFAPTAE